MESTSFFDNKYNEFVKELLETFPELSSNISAAYKLNHDDKIAQFRPIFDNLQKSSGAAGTSSTNYTVTNPGTLLPGVQLTDELWNSLSDSSKNAIWEHIRIISTCYLMETGFSFGEGNALPSWISDNMDEIKKKFESVDFGSYIEKFAKMFSFGNSSSSDVSGEAASGFKIPKLPEKFLKGHLARFAEEITRDIKLEDLGLNEDIVRECESSPSRALELLFNVLGKNPQNLEKLVKKIGSRLQQKFASGQINPQQIVAEVEELIKEFAGNTEFVESMSQIKSLFGFEDMEFAKKAGKEGSARLATVKDRLRKKLEQRKAAAGGSGK
jgi:hypothetical protein